METKLDKLETEREFLLEMCPKDKRDTYDTGKECTLVRILLRTLPAEYDPAVKSVRDLTKFRKYGLLGDLTQITWAWLVMAREDGQRRVTGVFAYCFS